MWTSALALSSSGAEFCHILNWSIWEDRVRYTCPLVRALNSFSVSGLRVGTPCVAPPSPLFRGGGFQTEHRPFFEVGLLFRIPPVWPTSSQRLTARRFMTRSSAPERIMWIIHCPDTCDHVYYVQRRAAGVSPEDEWLFSPYSAFKVRSVRWQAGDAHAPHEVELEAVRDNQAVSLSLPCAPWA